MLEGVGSNLSTVVFFFCFFYCYFKNTFFVLERTPQENKAWNTDGTSENSVFQWIFRHNWTSFHWFKRRRISEQIRNRTISTNVRNGLNYSSNDAKIHGQRPIIAWSDIRHFAAISLRVALGTVSMSHDVMLMWRNNTRTWVMEKHCTIPKTFYLN